MSSVLVTGGAGFIGSRLVTRLAEKGHEVVVLDNLHSQVHGPQARPPAFPAGVRFIRGGIEDREAVSAAVEEARPTLVFHLAAETGTGQSYDKISHYCAVNVGGTALLVEELKSRARDLQRIVLAGSRAVYGEGAHRSPDGRIIVPPPRTPARMQQGDFQPRDANGTPVEPVPTREDLPPAPASVYASTKLMQEHLLVQGFAGTAVEPVILRFQNVYGPGQSLRNPYTGVLSIFCAQILEGHMLSIFEDGEIVRDFVFVDDVVEALDRAGEVKGIGSVPINIGSGYPATILSTAAQLLQLLGAAADHLRISGAFRAGDIRFAVADIRRASEVLGWAPRTSLEQGLEALAAWAQAGGNS